MKVFIRIAMLVWLGACTVDGDDRDDTVDLKMLAQQVSDGSVDQDALLALHLDSSQRRAFVYEFGRVRDWNTDDLDADVAEHILFTPESEISPSPTADDHHNVGSCTQKVEQASGSTGSAYVAGIASPNPGECGPDNNDVFLVFNLYWGNTDPDKARYWSGLWWVRAALATYWGGLSTKGLCSNTARTCLGTRGLALSWNDIYSIYLWHL